MTKLARVTLTFEYDPERTSQSELVDRLDELLVEHFTPDDGVEDWNARWVGADLGAAPLFGAAKRPE